MKNIKLFFALLIVHCTFLIGEATAQWWVQGGNLLWPYGTVNISDGIIAGKQFRPSWEALNESSVANNQFYSNQESWYGGSAFFNLDDGSGRKIINPNSRMNGIDNMVWQLSDSLTSIQGMQLNTRITSKTSNGVWSNPGWPTINGLTNNLTLGNLPNKNYSVGDITLFASYIDELSTVTSIDTVPYNTVIGYHFRFGSGNKLRYPNFYAYYSDLVNFNASTKIQNGYHFYGYGDYPSYFGGVVKAKQFQLNALNTAPASATAAGTTGEIRFDTNYIYVCVATNTWKRVAIATW